MAFTNGNASEQAIARALRFKPHDVRGVDCTH